MEAVPYVDALFKEYLLFRGFTKTVQALDFDKAADRGLGFQAEQISDLVFGRLIPQHDGANLVELLAFLKAHVFSRLKGELESKPSTLEVSVLRLFLVHAIESEQTDRVHQFFSSYSEQLSCGPDAQEWAAWFALPFLQKPQRDPRFQVYFTKPWKQLVEATFRNYMAEAVQQLPLPAILRFNADRKQRQELQRRVEALQAELGRLHVQLKQRQPMRNSSPDLDGADSQRNSAATETVHPADSWTLSELLDTEYIANPGRAQRRNMAVGEGPGSGFGDLLQPEARSRSQQRSRALEPGIRTQPPSRAAAAQRGAETFVGLDAIMKELPSAFDSAAKAAETTSAETTAEGVDHNAAGEMHSSHSAAGPTLAIDSTVVLSGDSESEAEGEPSQSERPADDAFKEGSAVADLKHRPSTPLQSPRPQADDVSISSPHRHSPGSAHSSGRAAAEQELSRGPSAASDTSGRSLGSRLSSQQAASSLTSLAGQQEVLKGHEAAVTDVIFAPDGRNVASASTDGVVRIWAPGSLDGNSERSAVLLCGARVQRLAWDTRADKVMLVGTEGKGVKAWHLDTKRMVAHMRPDPAFPNINDVACSPTDPSFLCASSSVGKREAAGRLSLWNLRAFRKVHTFKSELPMLSVCFAPDGRSIAVAGDDGSVHLFDTSTTVSTAALPTRQTREGASFVRFIGPDGSSLLTLSPDGMLRAWDFAMLRGPTWQMDVSACCAAQGSMQQHRFAASPDGTAAALTAMMATAPVVQLFGESAKLGGGGVHRAAVSAVAWHPESRVVVSGSVDRTLIVTHLLDWR